MKHLPASLRRGIALGAMAILYASLPAAAMEPHRLSVEELRLIESLSQEKRTLWSNTMSSVTAAEEKREMTFDQAERRLKQKLRELAGTAPYENNVRSWLAPFIEKNPGNPDIAAFYEEAIATARNVDAGRLAPQTANKIIEEKRIRLNRQLAAKGMHSVTADAAPDILELNCTVTLPDGRQRTSLLTIDYVNATVNGSKAAFDEKEIRWTQTESVGTTELHQTLNRTSGFYSIGTGEFTGLWTGHCN